MKHKPMKYRIAKGIALLNREYGRSWLRKIDPERLALEDGNACVLGQVEGDYSKGLDKLDLNSGSEFGFNKTRNEKYHTLTRRWKQSIVQLQKLFDITPPAQAV